MILVTGAAGKTGRAVIQALATVGASVRAFVHRQEQRATVEALGAREVFCGDLRDPQALAQAAQGVRAVYHICPNVHPDEFAIGSEVIAAAAAADVKHFVFHSVLHPQTEAMPHHWHKLRVEERLFESGLPFTILQPTAYMQNILAYWPQIAEEGVYPVPYNVDAQTCLVDLVDVAEVAAQVLTRPGHVGATYELVGTDALTPRAIAGELGAHLGQPVAARQTPVEDWRRQAADKLSGYALDALTRMFVYYDRYGLRGNSKVLTCLLGRAPTSLKQFLRRERPQPNETLA